MVLQEKAAGVEEEEVAEGQLLVARAAGHRRKMGSSRPARTTVASSSEAPSTTITKLYFGEPVVQLRQRAACRHCVGVSSPEMEVRMLFTHQVPKCAPSCGIYFCENLEAGLTIFACASTGGCPHTIVKYLHDYYYIVAVLMSQSCC